jgi:phospholipid/cholesterol/gamma-HCH transport system permease protein
MSAWAGRPTVPGKAFVDTVGAIVVLTARTVLSAVRPPFPFAKEFVAQFLFALRMCWMPMILAAFAFTYGPAGIQSANFLSLFGALDRLGGLYVLVVVREFAPLVCALVVAGVAGTAMCADLGARKVREELDALQVLGVDPVKNLVVPRFLALVLATSMFNIYALIFGTVGGVLATVVNGGSLGPFWATYFNNASTTELAGSLAKTALFGGAIAVVCCFKGLNASGGAEGVGRAVNQAVVMSFLAIGVINFAFTQTLLALNPILSVPR